MHKKIMVLFFSILFSLNTFAQDQKMPIVATKIFSQTVNWTSASSADTLNLSSTGVTFSVHLRVDAASASSVSFSCSGADPIVIAPGSGIVCFVDDATSASWQSTTGASANGTYEIMGL